MNLLLSAQTRLLVVAPHPDDETLATGVLIQQVLAAGGAVHVLLLTDGDNNPWPQRWLERRWRISRDDRARWAQLRRGELRAAMTALGLQANALTAFGWPDQGLTARLQDAPAESLAALRAVLDAFAPNLLAMPSLGDRHPDHSAAHVLMRLAVAGTSHAPSMLLYMVHGATNGAADLVLPADGVWQQRKHAALRFHRSQLALSGKRMQRMAARAERYWFQPAMARAELPWHPQRVVWPWLSLAVVTSEGGSVWPWGNVRWPEPVAGDRDQGASGDAEAPMIFAKLQCVALPSLWIFDHWGWCEIRR